KYAASSKIIYRKDVTLPLTPLATSDGKRTLEQPLLGFVGFSSEGKIPTIISTSAEYFFNVPAEKIKTAAGGVRTIAGLIELNNLTNPIIWAVGKEGKIDSGTATVGTDGDPVMLVIDGDIVLTDKSSLTVYGILYVTGSITTATGTNITVYGQIAANGKINLNGNKNLISDMAILSKLGVLNKNVVKINYSGNNTGILQEVFY
ncbi:MAG: hypothetical protein WCH10_05390, partial [bacterium]